MQITYERLVELQGLEKIIKYTFKDKTLLNQALTHSSYNSGLENALPHYERLEFVGDSILGFIIGLYLFKMDKDVDEGQLTRIRADIVCEHSLAQIATDLSLGRYFLMSKGEDLTGGRERVSILADTVESIIAAIYLDSDLDTSTKFVLDAFKEIIEAAANNKLFSDYKSMIQEHVQKKFSGNIVYRSISEEGPDHDKTFIMEILLQNKVLGKGEGKTKKDAQQAAAKVAMENLGEWDV